MSYFEHIFAVRDVDSESELTIEPYNTTEKGPEIRIIAKKTGGSPGEVKLYLELDTAKSLHRSLGLAIRRSAAQFRKKGEDG